jgi:hypothetical protein
MTFLPISPAAGREYEEMEKFSPGGGSLVIRGGRVNKLWLGTGRAFARGRSRRAARETGNAPGAGGVRTHFTIARQPAAPLASGGQAAKFHRGAP